jgi:hypothetical protein
MANYVIVGAGASGLYTAYRLLTDGKLQEGDTVQLYEWSQRPGGRIYTYTFPDYIATDGLYVEVGGMRFATDKNFQAAAQAPDRSPLEITEGHLLVQNLISVLGIADKVVAFDESPERMYYLRGKHIYENAITTLDVLPYNFSGEFTEFVYKNLPLGKDPVYTADTLLGGIASVFAPNLGSANADRQGWCDYFGTGTVTDANQSTCFPQGTLMQNIGYWNLLYDQFGDEGFDYSADGTGYTSNVINWNAADAMQANNDYGSGTNYNRLAGGYSLLFETLSEQVSALMEKFPGSGIFWGYQLTSLAETEGASTTTCTFSTIYGDAPNPVVADQLFLAMPRRSLELVAVGCSPAYLLNNPQVKYYLESSIDQPAIKAVMVFENAWWTGSECAFPPQLQGGAGGPTITDLPLRMVYYFGNNIPSGQGPAGPYVLLASYDDMNYSDFWRVLETTTDFAEAPSLIRQPLTGPTSVPVDSPMAALLIKQLADVHGMTPAQIGTPMAVYFQDWGQDPFGGGYHGWAPHYNICQAMGNVRAPYQSILNQPDRKVYIVGSCYSFDQAWVEGALCTAESVLQDYVGLPAFNGISGYTLVCKPG